MKSSRISVVTMLLWAVVSFVGKAQNQAPEKIEYGVTAGANFSNLILNDEFKQLETKGMQLGGEMGAFMTVTGITSSFSSCPSAVLFLPQAVIRLLISKKQVSSKAFLALRVVIIFSALLLFLLTVIVLFYVLV